MHSIILLQFVPKELCPKTHAKVVSDNQAAYKVCCVEMMLVWMITEETWPWTAEESGDALESYRRSKFKKNAIAVPTLLEMCLCAQVANQFLAEGNVEGFEKWCDDALYDAPGIAVLQEYIVTTKAKRARLDPQQIVTLRRESGTDEKRTVTVQVEPEAESGDLAGPPSQSLTQVTNEATVGEEPVVGSLPVKDADDSVLPGKTTFDQPPVYEDEKDTSAAQSAAIQPKLSISDQEAND